MNLFALIMGTGLILWIASFTGLGIYGLVLFSERKHRWGSAALIACGVVLALGYLSIRRFG